MGIYDRHYWRGDPGGGPSGGLGGVTIGLPKPTLVVKGLLIANAAVFLVQLFTGDLHPDRLGWMSASLGVRWGQFWEVWRYITFQFLHGSVWHILLNMLAVYILGSPLEQHYGSRRFLVFYLSCGVAAGVAYAVIGALGGVPSWMPIIGASGGVYGIVLACAVYFPGFRIIFLFFPVPIRLAAIIIFGAMILLVLQAFSSGRTDRAMSDVAHLGGAVAAAVWVWGAPGIARAADTTKAGRARGAWQRKMREQAERQAEIDRILAKVHEQGIASLSEKEKRRLQDETRRQQNAEREFDRLG
ncbi:MAG TPA: rhomboid family intramembrane serine protease [Phycisphaerae bacterium]|nr:rhomboid family intramembrane serine protease [Phycisphaerae bacterium]